MHEHRDLISRSIGLSLRFPTAHYSCALQALEWDALIEAQLCSSTPCLAGRVASRRAPLLDRLLAGISLPCRQYQQVAQRNSSDNSEREEDRTLF